MAVPPESTLPFSRRRLFRLRSPEILWLASVAIFGYVSLVVVVLVTFCVFRRLKYPFELSWMEGVFVDHAQRIVAGKPIYDRPSADFIPLLYTPIYHYATSWLARAGFGGFLGARAVSLAGVSGAVVVCTWLVARATRHKWLCLCVPVLVAATYFDVDAYYDVGRPDNLMVLFCVLAVGALSLRSSVVAACLFVPFALAAIFTKQSAFIFFAVLLTELLFIRRRLALLGAIGLAAALVLAIWWANAATEGWFRFYVMELPSQHRLTHVGLATSVVRDFLGSFALPTTALILGLAAMLLTRRRSRGVLEQHERIYRLVLAGSVAAAVYSVSSSWNIGGARNVLVPYAVMSAAFLPLAIARAVDQLDGPLMRAVGWRLAMLVLSLAVLRGLQDPRQWLPRASETAEWKRFQTTIASYGPPERVWVLCHGAAHQSGGGAWAMRPHLVTIKEYLGGYGPATERELPEDLLSLIKRRYFRAIVVREKNVWLQSLIKPYYKRDPARRTITLPVFSGWTPGEERIWIPRKDRG